MGMHPFYLFFDPYLIWFYRLTGFTAVDFFVGTLVLACVALLVGKVTSFLASLPVRRHFEGVADEARKYQDLSMEALKAGDRSSYEAANQLANDAFSKSFFMQLALSATFFWPVFLALGWMQCRFIDVEFHIPGTKWALGFIGVFIVIYAFAYILAKMCAWFGKTKPVI